LAFVGVRGVGAVYLVAGGGEVRGLRAALGQPVASATCRTCATADGVIRARNLWAVAW
jgi:hypothetical protein